MYNTNQRSEGLLITIKVSLSALIIYSIYYYNPYFMHRKPLSESLTESQNSTTVVPFREAASDSLGPWENLTFMNTSSTNSYPPEFQMGSLYVRESLKELPVKVTDYSLAPKWSSGTKGLYFTYEQEIVKTNFDGDKIWSFKCESNDKFITQALEGSKYVFTSTQNGFVYKLNLENGSLNWLTKIDGPVVHNFLPYNSLMFFINQTASGNFFVNKINGHTGEFIWKHELVGFTQPTPLTISEEHKLLLLSDLNGSMLALDMNNGNAYWQAKKLGEIVAPPSTVGESIYVVNKEGIVHSLNIRKKSINWEYTLQSGAENTFSYIPSYGMISIMSDSGYLHTLESRTGEGNWKYNTSNEQALKQIVSIRYDGKSISKYKLNWAHKGWVILAACSTGQLCTFNPEKGQLIGRTKLYGEIMQQPPIFKDDKMYVLLKKPQALPWMNQAEELPKVALGIFKIFKDSPTPTGTASTTQ